MIRPALTAGKNRAPRSRRADPVANRRGRAPRAPTALHPGFPPGFLFSKTPALPKPLHLIVACAENRVIGRNRKLPWRIPEDLKFFHAATAGQICVLGRICYKTWPRAQAAGRRAIVLTSGPLAHARSHGSGDGEREQADNPPSDPIAVRSLGEALAVAETLPGEIFVCGGERIYAETLALAGTRPLRLHLTLIHADVKGDTFFPEWRHLAWQERLRRESSDANHRYSFYELELPASR
ncbi:MAG: dihydrofolate reductase [Opitutus sp.]|nr:dihydrofolate reductase [Opitutus sp.]